MPIYHLLYRTTTASNVPAVADMPPGRLALNTTDERIFFRNTAGTVVEPVPRAHTHTVAQITDIGSNYIPLTQKGAVNGVASLGADGKVPAAQLPTTTSGTVTSVAMTVPTTLLTVSGSPITTSGTLAVTTANTTAGAQVWAGPTAAAGAPTYRVLAAGDIPSLDASQITTGVFDPSQLGSNSGNSGRFLAGTGMFRTLFISDIPFAPINTISTDTIVIGFTQGQDLIVGNYNRTTSTTPVTITVNSFAAQPGNEYHVHQAAAGVVTFVAGSGVTINAPFGGSLVLPGQGATVTLKCVDTDVYDLLGQTGAA